jgi:hypothetical protein
LGLCSEKGPRQLFDYWPVIEEEGHSLPLVIDSSLKENTINWLTELDNLDSNSQVSLEDDLEQRWYQAYSGLDETEQSRLLKILLKVRSKLWEQLKHAEIQDCSVFLGRASINNLEYGAINLLTKQDSDKVFVQSISCYLAPSLIQLWYPDSAKKLPELNQLLMPTIETWTRMQSACRIETVCCDEQAQILQDRYGFYQAFSQEPPIDYFSEHFAVQEGAKFTCSTKPIFLIKLLASKTH